MYSAGNPVSKGLAYGSKGLVCVQQECANLAQANGSTGCRTNSGTIQGTCRLDLSADMLRVMVLGLRSREQVPG